MYAHVIIDNPSSQVDIEFDYLIPSSFNVLVGMRVKVPFGPSNKPTLGIVLEVSNETTYQGNVKEILEVLDKEPILNTESIEIAKYIKKETICPISRVLNLMIPHAKRLKTVLYLQILNGNNLDANLLKEFKGETICKYTPRFDKYEAVIKKAIENNDLKIIKDAVEKKTKKWIKKYIVNLEQYNLFFDELKNIDAKNLLNDLKGLDPLTIDEIISNYGVSEYLIKKLHKTNYLKEVYELSSNIKERTLSIKINDLPKIDYINKYMDKYLEFNKFLYLCNSKTEEQVFIKELIDKNNLEKKNTLIIVPDILRGYELYTLIKRLFNNSVCNLNSSLSENEIDEYYDLILNNEFEIIITTPAYSLWPYQNIGCILMIDQESSNYRNDQSPRYDLNLVMDKIASLKQSKLVYHSYCPLLSTYTLSMLDKITLLSTKVDLEKDITIVNMMEALRRNESLLISNTLKEKMDSVLNKKEAVLLILNNKGYSKSISCRVCGSSINCPKCKIPLQYHKEKEELYCPACYHKVKKPNMCPKCYSDKLSYNGFGMEQLSEVIKKMYPNKNVLTLKDSSYLDLEEVIYSLNDESLDILITSDTFSRSINSKRLKLVGIVNLDVVLNTPSFDANHQAYSMLQHAKEIGKDIEMVIQTYSPKHYVLKNFILNNYDEYYFVELNNRKSLQVEPLYEVNRILVQADYNEVFKVANNIKKTILNIIKEDIFVIGPSYNFKEKKVQLIVKHKNKNISNLYMHIYELYQKTNIKIIFDRYSKNIS